VEQKEKRLRNFSLSRFFHWWAHQDWNLGPKEYESRHPKKTTGILSGYSTCLSARSILCYEINDLLKTRISLFGFKNHRNFGELFSASLLHGIH